MNDGVRIIIERMKTNPEEFEGRGKFRWVADILDDVVEKRGQGFWFLRDEDRQALESAWAEKHADMFTKGVMTTLFDDNYETRMKEDEELQRLKLQQEAYKQQLAQYNSAQQARNNTGGLFGLGGLGGIFK